MFLQVASLSNYRSYLIIYWDNDSANILEYPMKYYDYFAFTNRNFEGLARFVVFFPINHFCFSNKMVFGVQQWLGLIYPQGSIYVDSLRECYEAYVIYNFMMYLLAYLNEDRQLEHRLEMSPQVHHMFPLCCLPNWEMGREFVHMCKHGILQYTVVRPISTLVSL